MSNARKTIRFALTVAATITCGLLPWVKEGILPKPVIYGCVALSVAWWVCLFWNALVRLDAHAATMLDMGAMAFTLAIPFLIIVPLITNNDISYIKLLMFGSIAVSLWMLTKLSNLAIEKVSNSETNSDEEGDELL